MGKSCWAQSCALRSRKVKEVIRGEAEGAAGVLMIDEAVDQGGLDEMGVVGAMAEDATIEGVGLEDAGAVVGDLDQAEAAETDMGDQGAGHDAIISVREEDTARVDPQGVVEAAAGSDLEALKVDADSKLHFTRIL